MPWRTLDVVTTSPNSTTRACVESTRLSQGRVAERLGADAERLAAGYARGRRTSGCRSSRSAKGCILIWLAGGASHLDTFDPKPDAAGRHSRRIQADRDLGARSCRSREILPRAGEVDA